MKKRMLCLLMIAAALLSGCTATKETSAPETPPTDEVPEATQAPERTAKSGTLENGVYTNEYAGFGITMDSGWTITPADELQDLPEILEDAFEGTELEGYDVTQFTDIMAENTDQAVSFNVLYQKLSLQDRLAFSTMNEDEILDILLEERDTLVQAYENAGITVESLETKKVSFLGEERTAMYTVSSIGDIPYYILQLFSYDLGSYSVTLTASSFFEDNCQSVLDAFYRLDP